MNRHQDLEAISASLTKEVTEARQLLQMEQAEKAKLEKLRADRALSDQALTLLRLAIKEKVNVKERLEQFATFLLQATFGPDFHFGFEVVTNQSDMVTGLAPRITRHGMARHALKNGGGAANMSATGLRFAMHMLHDSKELAPIMLFDEVGANLDSEKWPEFITALQLFAEKAGVQIFLITHTGHGFPCKVKTSMRGQASSARIVSESAA